MTNSGHKMLSDVIQYPQNNSAELDHHSKISIPNCNDLCLVLKVKYMGSNLCAASFLKFLYAHLLAHLAVPK